VAGCVAGGVWGCKGGGGRVTCLYGDASRRPAAKPNLRGPRRGLPLSQASRGDDRTADRHCPRRCRGHAGRLGARGAGDRRGRPVARLPPGSARSPAGFLASVVPARRPLRSAATRPGHRAGRWPPGRRRRGRPGAAAVPPDPDRAANRSFPSPQFPAFSGNQREPDPEPAAQMSVTQPETARRSARRDLPAGRSGKACVRAAAADGARRRAAGARRAGGATEMPVRRGDRG